MEHHRAFFFIFLFRCAGLVCAASSRNDASGNQLLAGASARQPQRLVSEASAAQSVSLLEIVHSLQHAPAAVASEVQVQGRDFSGETTHERQLLSDMGHLETQLESWRHAEQDMEHQVVRQEAMVKSLRTMEAKAIHDEQVAAVVWWDCKMMMCLGLIFAIAYCVYASNSQTGKASPVEKVLEPVRRTRPQVEFVEKDAGQDVEDTLLVSVQHPLPGEKLRKALDLEAPNESQQIEELQVDTKVIKHVFDVKASEASMQHSASENTQFFAMDDEEDPTSPKGQWWDESASGY